MASEYYEDLARFTVDDYIVLKNNYKDLLDSKWERLPKGVADNTLSRNTRKCIKRYIVARKLLLKALKDDIYSLELMLEEFRFCYAEFLEYMHMEEMKENAYLSMHDSE